MKRIQFYTCPACGNILIATGGAEIACCGRKLGAMKARACDETHALHVEEMDGEWYVTLNHPMTKAHFIRFIACVGMERVLLCGCIPNRMPRCACRKCRMRRGISDAAKTACTHAG